MSLLLYQTFGLRAALQPAVMPAKLTGEAAEQTMGTLRSILFTCLFIATKVADQVRHAPSIRALFKRVLFSVPCLSTQNQFLLSAPRTVHMAWHVSVFRACASPNIAALVSQALCHITTFCVNFLQGVHHLLC